MRDAFNADERKWHLKGEKIDQANASVVKRNQNIAFVGENTADNVP
jgi:hypothetical protein